MPKGQQPKKLKNLAKAVFQGKKKKEPKLPPKGKGKGRGKNPKSLQTLAKKAYTRDLRAGIGNRGAFDPLLAENRARYTPSPVNFP